MYTQKSIHALIAQYDDLYRSLDSLDSKQEVTIDGKRGTVGTLRLFFHRQQHNAEIVHQHMVNNRIQEAKAIGPFHRPLPQKGDKIRLAKGTEVRTTHPKYRGTRHGKVLSRAQTILVDHTYEGHIIHNDIYEGTVHWIGTGGYWFWANIGDVEVI